MSFALLLLCFGLPSAETRFYDDVAQRDRGGISHIRVAPAHDHHPIKLSVHPTAGCLIQFSQSYDHMWAADQSAGAGGGNFSYTPFGPNYRAVIIKPVRETDATFNVFFAFGNHTIELMLQQAPDLEGADRRVTLQLVTHADQPQPAPRRTVDTQAQTKKKKDSLLKRIFQRGHVRIKRKAFTAAYRTDHAPFLVLAQNGDLEGRPALQSVEIVRGKRGGWWGRKTFRGYPVAEQQIETLDDLVQVEFPQQVLERGEHLYLKLKHVGQRTPTYYKLRAGK